MNEVYGAPLTIEAIIDENLEMESNNSSGNKDENNKKIEESPVVQTVEDKAPVKKSEEGDGMMNDLLKTFGGKVIG